MSRRRVEGAALAAVLAVGGAVPVAQWAASAATKAAPCATWTDPAGDSSTGELANPTGQIGDANLDIVHTTFATTTDSFSATMKLSALNDSPSDAGDMFYVEFTAGGVNLRIYAGRNGTGGFPTASSVGLYNSTAGTRAADKATAIYDYKAGTVTLSAKLADLASLAGVSLKNAAVTALTSYTRDDFVGQGGFVYDESTTTLSPVFGVACGSSASGTPTAKPSATPSPKPTTTTGGGSTAPQVSADPSKDLPKSGCTTFTDPKGDASYNGTPNDPDLDITTVTMRTTSTALVTYIGVDKLATGPSITDTHRFSVDFTFNGHVFTASASTSARGSHAVRDAAANSGLVGHVVQLGMDVPSTTAVPPPTERGLKVSGLTATFDLANSRVVLVLPIADIEKYGAAKFTGKLTAINAKSSMDSNILSLPTDTQAKANAATSTDTWTVNDNVCFPKKK